ncbi:hypothetical protein E4Q23_07295 [Candidatus Accumulibacter phosphatis]|uniref:Uncharacterized protein n=1 Tax=Candidatus Accumulibacter phosphatis TaxID=327160 RepID=A0ABX1TXI2_9PROT|nr:hypothetical protein [Candidatus Accumulibacter phosphatis]NMQ27577.1 hypothetical protein [Candidatus Accumulibacter phosphatis]
MKRLLALLLLTFLSLPLAAAPPSAEINLDIGTPPVILVKHTLAQRGSRLVYFFGSRCHRSGLRRHDQGA